MPEVLDPALDLAGDLDGAEHGTLELGRLALELERSRGIVHGQGAAAEIDDLERSAGPASG